MGLLEIMERFPNQEACIEHLEKIRWGNKPSCTHCGSVDIVRKKEEGVGRIGRWNCHDCNASFKVTCGTIFHGTKIDLQKWFLAISLILNAKKSISSCQLARDLDLNQKTAWRIEMCIRSEMAKKEVLLQGIIEADETYIGGKPRKANKKEDRKPSKRGRGTNKTAILGAVERGGKVVAEVANELTKHAISNFIQRYVNIKDSELITDEFEAYSAIGKKMKHQIIKHQEQYAEGEKHTNAIEGFLVALKKSMVWFTSSLQSSIHAPVCSRGMLQIQL